MNFILIVDDSAMDRQVAGSLLEKTGRYQVEFAADGLEALEHLERHVPLAVITDLQMPGMDGLQLVQAVHRGYANVPVILMTAFGSEEIALEALIQGAVDYVPKSRMVAQLTGAVDSALAAATSVRPTERMLPFVTSVNYAWQLPNDLSLIAEFSAHVQAKAGELMPLNQCERARLAKAVKEALHNAMVHGNLELTRDQADAAGAELADFVRERSQQRPYCDRQVTAHLEVKSTEARITIRDAGPGFDHRSLPDIHASPGFLADGSDHGLVVMRMFVDEVHFNSAGNEVTLLKRSS